MIDLGQVIERPVADWAIQIALGCALAGILAAAAIIDLRRMILPDRLTALLAAGGVAQCLALGQPTVTDAALGALFGGGTLMAIATTFRRLRGIDGLGRGDQKLVAAAGIWVGWQGLPLMLLVASASALVFCTTRAVWSGRLDRTARLPFGPFLGVGALSAWLALVTLQGKGIAS
jgi:prepilin signal peptidase PulO-like enzyme (type II secretory pathway)